MMASEIFDRKEVYVGRDFGGVTYDITPGLVATYVAGTGDDNPWYRGQSPLGGAVAPALILHSAVYQTLGWYLPNIYGNLHARQEWSLFAPVMVGERLTTRSVIVDRYLKRDREYVVNEVLVSNASGQIVSRSRTHQSFLLPEQTKQGFVVDKSREKDSAMVQDTGRPGAPGPNTRVTYYARASLPQPRTTTRTALSASVCTRCCAMRHAQRSRRVAS